VGEWELPCELCIGVNFTPQALDAAADACRFVQSREPEIRNACRTALCSGAFNVNLQDGEDRRLRDPALLDTIRPCQLVFHPDRQADLIYEFDALPAANYCGTHVMQARMEQGEVQSVYLQEQSFYFRGGRILARPVPPGLSGFVDSVPDQCVVLASETTCFLEYDPELDALFTEAEQDVQQRMPTGSSECDYYLHSVYWLIHDMAIGLRAAG
jgi:hypothetical protein